MPRPDPAERRRCGSRIQIGRKPPHEVTLQFTLRDTDGFKARDPIFLTLVAVPDEPPEVKVRLVGTREPVVTPKGRLPVTGTITDDHGLGRVWWAYTVEERAHAGNPGETVRRLFAEACRAPQSSPPAIGRSAAGRVA